jgi:serine/threonine-protein kinase
LDDAIAEFHKALQIQPDYAKAWCKMAYALRDQGKLTESLASFRRGHELGSRNPDWAYPSADRVREAEELVRLDALLPAFLSGAAAPIDADARLRLADFCQRYKHDNTASARFYADAFAADPRLAENPSSNAHYNAACAAALAGCGQGDDAATLNEKERAHWRQQARDWLRADLTVWTKQLHSSAEKDRTAAAQTLQHWKEDVDLAGVRDADGLANPPPEERDSWRKLWADVDGALKQAQAK